MTCQSARDYVPKGLPSSVGGIKGCLLIYVLICLALLFALTFSAGASPPVLELEPGANQVSVLVANKRGIPLRSVDAAVEGQLPGWLRIAGTTPTDVPAKGEGRLSLNLEVAEVPPGTSGELPLLLKDKAGHSWRLKAEVEVVPPRKYELLPNFPNPFNPTTTIAFSIPGVRQSPVQKVECTLVVYNILGQKVKTLVDGPKAPGRYKVEWDGTDGEGLRVASGVYFFRLTAGDFVQTGKMLLLK